MSIRCNFVELAFFSCYMHAVFFVVVLYCKYYLIRVHLIYMLFAAYALVIEDTYLKKHSQRANSIVNVEWIIWSVGRVRMFLMPL